MGNKEISKQIRKKDLKVNLLAPVLLLRVSVLLESLSSSGYRDEWLYSSTAAVSGAVWTLPSLSLHDTSGRSRGLLVTLECEEVPASLARFNTAPCPPSLS